MDQDAYWDAVRTTRHKVADLLASLRPEEWERPSLCEGWRVRDVAGHLSLIPTVSTVQLLAAAPRARFDLNRVNTMLARRSATSSPQDLVATIRAHADRRTTARVLDQRNALFDATVHSQDIALPLGREFTVPPEVARAGLDRVWEMGWPFRARRRLGHLSLRATDADWATGSGPEVTGPALALLLLSTGRTEAASPALRGPGVEALRAAA